MLRVCEMDYLFCNPSHRLLTAGTTTNGAVVPYSSVLLVISSTDNIVCASSTRPYQLIHQSILTAMRTYIVGLDSDCRCVCIQQPNCPRRTTFNSHTCTCKCENQSRCNSNQLFNMSQCWCKNIIRNPRPPPPPGPCPNIQCPTPQQLNLATCQNCVLPTQPVAAEIFKPSTQLHVSVTAQIIHMTGAVD